jgi:dimethylargininase
MLTAITRAVSQSLGNCELTWQAREPIDIEEAQAEHRGYEHLLESLGARVISLPALEEYPDAVFVEDAAIVLDEIAVIATMGVESRRGERDSVGDALSKFRSLINMRGPAKLEGGDVMRIGDELYVGLSARTDEAGIEQLARRVQPFGYRVVPMKLRDCLHLKSACCFIGDDTILLNRQLVDTEPLHRYRLLDVAPSEPNAANALRVNETVVLPSAFPATAELLENAGFHVAVVNITELLKAESGVTCSSLLFDD